MKIYITLKNADQVTNEQLAFEPTETSMKLTVQNHMDRNHTLNFLNLAFKIKPTESTCKVSTKSLNVNADVDFPLKNFYKYFCFLLLNFNNIQ